MPTQEIKSVNLETAQVAKNVWHCEKNMAC